MTAGIIFAVIVLFAAYCILRAGAMAQEHNDKIRRDEYNKRNTLKGGDK